MSDEAQVFFFQGKVVQGIGGKWSMRNPKKDEDVAPYPVLVPRSVEDALNIPPEEDAERTRVTEATVKAEIQDAILMEVRALEKPWQMLGEAGQQEVIGRMDKRVSDILNQVVPILVNHEFPVVRATLGDVTVKDKEIAAKLRISKNAPDRFDVFDHVGMDVELSIIDRRAFEGEEGKVKADKDQGELNLPEGEDADNPKEPKPDDPTQGAGDPPENGDD